MYLPLYADRSAQQHSDLLSGPGQNRANNFHPSLNLVRQYVDYDLFNAFEVLDELGNCALNHFIQDLRVSELLQGHACIHKR